MRKSGWIGLALAMPGWLASAAVLHAGDGASGGGSPFNGASSGTSGGSSANSASSGNQPSKKQSGSSSSDDSSSEDSSSDDKNQPKVYCRAPNAPYDDYKCLDAYLGAGFLERFINYYRLEWGHSKAPEDPDAPDARRKWWPEAPAKTPPYPFTEWPYGGTTPLGVTRPNSVDSPLMVALYGTDFGQMMKYDHIQIYGWINGGGNISSNTVRPGGNYPISYTYTPNVDELDQAVIYVERLPDTVQTDHVDWGFRISALYGETYRYTTAFGFADNQLHGHDLFNGYDSPMLYGEVFMPQFADGLMVRFGRFISIPDIELQLAPNNYMYIHSLAYSFDNFTNTGVIGSLAVNKNWILQFGVTCGTDTMCWNIGATVPNPFPNAVFGNKMLKDPGAQPSYTAAARWQSDSGHDAVYVVENGINNGTWGYNNLQWTGLTWYHKISPDWHFAWETYYTEQRDVLNQLNPTAQQIISNGGYPFSPANGFPFNAPFFAQCDPGMLTCTARAIASVFYLNHQFSPLDNLSYRAEFFDDMEGQRTGTKTSYVDFGIGWQHWLSPQVEIRPEMDYYRSLDAPAFNGNSNANPVILPNKHNAVIVAADLIWHF
jgi:hypothetical protein